MKDKNLSDIVEKEEILLKVKNLKKYFNLKKGF